MKPKKILIAPSSFAETDKSPLNRIISAGYTIHDNPYKRKLTKNELSDLLTDDVVGSIAGLEIYDKDIMVKSKLQVISRVGSGISNIDIQSAKDLGIEIHCTPSGPTEAVAELAIGSLICLMRHVSLMDRDLHNRQWNKKTGYQLQNKTVMIIGFGKIGRRVAELLLPFNVNILVVDPFLNNIKEKQYKLCTLNEALPQADIISIHSSGESCILGENEFALMKNEVFVLNAARGSIISENSLISALDNGRVLGAWIDTFQDEPYNGPLCGYQQVILTPHIGSYTNECRSSMENEAVDNLLKALKKSD